MKKVIITLITVLLACSCATEAGLAIDMRISEPSYRAYYVPEDPTDEFAVTPLAVEEPIIVTANYYTPPMVGAMLSVGADNNDANLKVDGGDIVNINKLTGSYEAPSLPPTTLEEETYNGRPGFLNRAVSSSSPSIYETSVWDVPVKPVSLLGSSDGVELDIRMTDKDNTLSSDFNEPTKLSLDISDWNEPESFRPMWIDEDGRGSTIIPYNEYGDDWDGEWEPGTWRDEEQFKPNNPGTYEVYGW